MSCFSVESFKPGWARVNFNYFISKNEANFITEAVNQIAECGWILLPLYVHDLKSGIFVHHTLVDSDGNENLDAFRVSSLHDFSFKNTTQGSKGEMKATYSKPKCLPGERSRSSYEQTL